MTADFVGSDPETISSLDFLMRSQTKRNPDSTSRKRSLLGRWLDRIGGAPATTTTQRGRLMLETLENRQLLAGDVELLFTDGADTVQDDPPAESNVQSESTLSTVSEPEGELQPDLVAFAQALTDAGVVFYGAHWCPACTIQKELFEDGKDNLPFIEVTKPGPIAEYGFVSRHPRVSDLGVSRRHP